MATWCISFGLALLPLSSPLNPWGAQCARCNGFKVGLAPSAWPGRSLAPLAGSRGGPRWAGSSDVDPGSDGVEAEPEAKAAEADSSGAEQVEEDQIILPEGDWREFRARLIARDKSEPMDASEEAERPRLSVAAKNEQLLRSQSEDLFAEYMQGAWAHSTSIAETGGLLLRRPLEHQVQISPGAIREHIFAEAKRDLQASIGKPLEKKEFEARLEQWTSNVAYMYRLSERVLQEELAAIVAAAEAGDAMELDEAQQQLLLDCQHYANSWQEVLLILRHSTTLGTMGVVINRPLANRMSPQLANVFLSGLDNSDERTPSEQVADFTQSFREGVMYQGGPEFTQGPGILVHGVDLDGAAEVAPATKIFTGGHDSAAKAIQENKASPMDFRLFLGRRTWGPGELEREIQHGYWQPAACSRPVALKQCLALPKPLWHEVMELMGGSFKELSRLEITKRSDLET